MEKTMYEMVVEGNASVEISRKARSAAIDAMLALDTYGTDEAKKLATAIKKWLADDATGR